jgi:hypothetical protein
MSALRSQYALEQLWEADGGDLVGIVGVLCTAEISWCCRHIISFLADGGAELGR